MATSANGKPPAQKPISPWFYLSEDPKLAIEGEAHTVEVTQSIFLAPSFGTNPPWAKDYLSLASIFGAYLVK